MVFKSQLPDSIPPAEYRDLVSNFFWLQLDKFAQRVLFVDYETGRHWTGKQIKETSAQVAEQLIAKVQLRPEDNCVFFYKNCDFIQITALASLFAGASVCVGEPEDPEREQLYMIELLAPKCVFVCDKLRERMCSLRAKLRLNFKLVIMDDDTQELDEFGHDEFGLHTHLLHGENKQVIAASLPVQVDPNRAAFVIFTSGSTGKPKAVNRSQRNSLYVCFSLPEHTTGHLWNLNSDSVLAGHLQLDHGTGTFCLKMTLAKGLRLIIMKRFKYSKLVRAIEQHHISDLICGSALLHNLISDHLDESASARADLSSVRNVIATGSPLVSMDKVHEFARLYPKCSVRQGFGMTECGFLTLVEKARALSDEQLRARTVGPLMPNVRVKLLEPTSGKEVTSVNEEGELYVAGPTLSPGYLGESFKQQSAQAFLPDGFYRSSDIGVMCVDPIDQVQRLKIIGRLKDVLLLYDGWKVLPSELEELIMEHPQVKEAAVVGAPHPELPSCHAPRAYVVPKRAPQSNGTANGAPRQQVSEQEIFDFVAQRTSEPKHLIGGVKLMRELPRISIGKVDKKLLKLQDGLPV